MLEILPLHALRQEDGPLVGSSLLNLSQLAQKGLPVVGGVVVLPPEFALKTVISHLDLKDREIFEQRLEIVRREVKKIPVPAQLDMEVRRKGIDANRLWQHLLDLWLSQIRSKIWREGLGNGVNLGLSAQPVLFTQNIRAWGSAYFDLDKKKAVVTVEKGDLSEKETAVLEEIITKSSRLLLLPYLFDWVIDKNIPKLTRLKEFTQTPQTTDGAGILVSPLSPTEADEPRKCSLKIYLNLDATECCDERVDGYYLGSDSEGDWDKKSAKLLNVSGRALEAGMIYKLSDSPDRYGGVRGTLRLIHHSKELDLDIEALKLFRKKNPFTTMSIAVPFCRSIDEFLELKRLLSSKGFSRGSRLKLVLEMAVPENFLNLESYLEAGFDRALINLDELAGLLGGFDPAHHESFYYKKQIDALLRFLEPVLKILHKNTTPFIICGELGLHDDVLSFLLQKGAWGIIVGHSDAMTIYPRINLLEKNLVKYSSSRLGVAAV